MNKYIGENRLTYLWGKIKAFVSNAISGKVDKVSSSTDNAVVRFDGTAGAIQNSGVTIDDNNKVHAKAFVTDGGDDEQYVMGDGSLDTIESFTDSEMDVLLDENNGHITIETITDPRSFYQDNMRFRLGDTIYYIITVTNDGNLPITNIVIENELCNNVWSISRLDPFCEKIYKTSYTVTEDDILAGEVVSVTSGTGVSPDPEKPDVPVEPGVDPEPTEDPHGHLTITTETTSTPANDEIYALGETIEYKITVTNDGNLTITDIEIEGLNPNDNFSVSIDSLIPGESAEFSAAHLVTSEDVIEEEYVFEVYGTASSPDPDKPDAPIDPNPCPEPIYNPNS